MSNITQREIEIAEFISLGCSEKEIAKYLNISESTVGAHKVRLFQKTGSHNIADVTRWYFNYRLGAVLTPSRKTNAAKAISLNIYK